MCYNARVKNLREIEMVVLKKFWRWYEENYRVNVGMAALLFFVQIIHLLWLLVEVIWMKLFGFPLIHFHDLPRFILILVDYTEIPAIIAVSLIYIDSLRKEFTTKSLVYLIFLNSQWLHLFWITDEFVIENFVEGTKTVLPAWLAWVAILIDYLELPVIYDTIKRFVKSKKAEVFLEKEEYSIPEPRRIS